jgi:hypothetical protein
MQSMAVREWDTGDAAAIMLNQQKSRSAAQALQGWKRNGAAVQTALM